MMKNSVSLIQNVETSHLTSQLEQTGSLLKGGGYMVYIVSIIVACIICVLMRYLENKRINDPPHYKLTNKSSDNLSYKIDGIYGEKTKYTIKKTTGGLRLRRGTTEMWKANPVLGDGEIVFDRTAYGLKVGDGKKTFTELDYIGGGVRETLNMK